MPLRRFHGRAAIQRDTPVAGASLQGVSQGVAPFRVPKGLSGPIADIRVTDVGPASVCFAFSGSGQLGLYGKRLPRGCGDRVSWEDPSDPWTETCSVSSGGSGV